MSKDEFTILERISELDGCANVSDLSPKESEALSTLVIRGFLEREIFLKDNSSLYNSQTAYLITDAGRVALADARQFHRNRRWDNIRYWITTAIAVAALIVSIIALRSHVG